MVLGGFVKLLQRKDGKEGGGTEGDRRESGRQQLLLPNLQDLSEQLRSGKRCDIFGWICSPRLCSRCVHTDLHPANLASYSAGQHVICAADGVVRKYGISARRRREAGNRPSVDEESNSSCLVLQFWPLYPNPTIIQFSWRTFFLNKHKQEEFWTKRLWKLLNYKRRFSLEVLENRSSIRCLVHVSDFRTTCCHGAALSGKAWRPSAGLQTGLSAAENRQLWSKSVHLKHNSGNFFPSLRLSRQKKCLERAVRTGCMRHCSCRGCIPYRCFGLNHKTIL